MDCGLENEPAVVAPLPLDEEWLPSLECLLPGLWTNIAISNKAVKSDNAVVDFYPWNQSIMLVMPSCTLSVIFSIEELAIRRWQRVLTMSFSPLLTREHGSDWSARLRLYLSTSWAVDQNSGPATKRRKVHQTLTRSSVNDMGVGVFSG